MILQKWHDKIILLNQATLSQEYVAEVSVENNEHWADFYKEEYYDQAHWNQEVGIFS